MVVSRCCSLSTGFYFSFYKPISSLGWLGGEEVSVSDLWLRGRRFDSQLEQHQATTVGKLLTPMSRAFVTKQYNLVPAKGRWCSVAGKVTIGLACGTDFSGLSTYGLTATEREMSTLPVLQSGALCTLLLLAASLCMAPVSTGNCLHLIE